MMRQKIDNKVYYIVFIRPYFTCSMTTSAVKFNEAIIFYYLIRLYTIFSGGMRYTAKSFSLPTNYSARQRSTQTRVDVLIQVVGLLKIFLDKILNVLQTVLNVAS